MNGIKKNKSLSQSTMEKKLSKKETPSKSSKSMKKEYGKDEKSTRGTETFGEKTSSKKVSPKMNPRMITERESSTGARNFEDSEKRTSNFDKSFKNDCNCRCNDKKCK